MVTGGCIIRPVKHVQLWTLSGILMYYAEIAMVKLLEIIKKTVQSSLHIRRMAC